MPDPFLFALRLSEGPRFHAMLGDLAGRLLEQAGYGAPAIADILAKVREALDEGATGGLGKCDVQFRAEGGQLTIVVAYAGGREWRVTRALPD